MPVSFCAVILLQSLKRSVSSSGRLNPVMTSLWLLISFIWHMTYTTIVSFWNFIFHLSCLKSKELEQKHLSSPPLSPFPFKWITLSVTINVLCFCPCASFGLVSFSYFTISLIFSDFTVHEPLNSWLWRSSLVCIAPRCSFGSRLWLTMKLSTLLSSKHFTDWSE